MNSVVQDNLKVNKFPFVATSVKRYITKDAIIDFKNKYNIDDVTHLEDISTRCMDSYPCRGHKIQMHYKNNDKQIYQGSGDGVYLLYYLCSIDIPEHYAEYKNITIFI